MSEFNQAMAVSVLKRIAQRSHRVNFHTYGCTTRGREEVLDPFSRADGIEPEIVKGACSCGWVDEANQINKILEEVDHG